MEMKDGYTMTVLANYVDDEHAMKVMNGIPNLDNFAMAYVEF